jgi:spermidine synthase
MVPSHRPSRALLLGLGAGTVARLLVARFGTVPIVGVDDDPSVIALAREELEDVPSLEIVQQDAFEYVATATAAFDLACVDLYRGAEIQAGIIHRPFLRQLRSLLEPRGLAVFNLAQDRQTDTRVTRLGRVFRVLRTEQVGKNLVVWCR